MLFPLLPPLNFSPQLGLGNHCGARSDRGFFVNEKQDLCRKHVETFSAAWNWMCFLFHASNLRTFGFCVTPHETQLWQA